MAAFVTLAEVEAISGKQFTESEEERVNTLLPLISDLLRSAAARVGKNLDAMIAADATYESVVKLVTTDVTVRAMRQSTDGEPMSQESQSAGGYTWSGTYSIPGGGVANALMRNDLKRLGLLTQTAKAVYMYGENNGNNSNAL
jgi:hypothetical protein